MDCEMQIHKSNEAPVDILNTPAHHLRGVILQMARNSRQCANVNNRKEHCWLEEVDQYATNCKNSSPSDKDLNLLRVSQAGAALSMDALHHAGSKHDNKCTYCDADAICTNKHLVCECGFF